MFPTTLLTILPPPEYKNRLEAGLQKKVQDEQARRIMYLLYLTYRMGGEKHQIFSLLLFLLCYSNGKERKYCKIIPVLVSEEAVTSHK